MTCDFVSCNRCLQPWLCLPSLVLSIDPSIIFTLNMVFWYDGKHFLWWNQQLVTIVFYEEIEVVKFSCDIYLNVDNIVTLWVSTLGHWRHPTHILAWQISGWTAIETLSFACRRWLCSHGVVALCFPLKVSFASKPKISCYCMAAWISLTERIIFWKRFNWGSDDNGSWQTKATIWAIA